LQLHEAHHEAGKYQLFSIYLLKNISFSKFKLEMSSKYHIVAMYF